MKIRSMYSVIMMLTLLCLFLTGCSTSQTAQVTQKPTTYITTAPTIRRTPLATFTPEPLPSILEVLNDFYNAHEGEDEYQIKTKPQKGYIDGEYTMSLVADEVPDSNGTAIIKTKRGSKSFEIVFQYSNFYGNNVCSPSLIKAVSVATVDAIAQLQNLDNVDELTKSVLASYDESKYTRIVFAGDYAFSYKPKDTYATILTALNITEFNEAFSDKNYATASYDDMTVQLNSGTKYSFAGTVKTYDCGEYSNSFATYKCMIVEVGMDNGKTVRVVQFPEDVPISFEKEKKYTFYGTTMFDTSGELLFYLHNAKML